MAEVLSNDEVAALVLASRSGDQAAWGVLIERLSPMVWGIARSYGLDPHDAVDVSQTTWMQFARCLASLDEPRKAPGWLATTARRECSRHLRARRNETSVAPSSLAHVSSNDRVDAGVDADTDRRIIRQAIEALPEGCRLLVRMLLAEPTPSYETVAETLGITVNAVGPKRSRCLSYLKRELEERFGMKDDQ